MNIFSEEEKNRLRRDYCTYKFLGRLEKLGQEMRRTKHFLCRQAKALGLTDPKHERRYHAVWKYMPEDEARCWMEKFKKSSLGLGRFCRKCGIDDVGFARTMRRYFADEYEPLIELKAPRSSKYRRGRQFEYRVKNDLKKQGYFVLRSPASKSPLDLVAIGKNKPTLFIQCKTGDALGVQEWNELFDLSEQCGAIPVLVIREGLRDVRYFKLTGKKDGSKKTQPRIEIRVETE